MYMKKLTQEEGSICSRNKNLIFWYHTPDGLTHELHCLFPFQMRTVGSVDLLSNGGFARRQTSVVSN